MQEKDISKLLEEIKKLKEENKKLKSRKKYGLVWEEEKEPEQVVLDCQKKLPILKEVKSKEILTDKNKPMNILIEGDNYHALQVLNYTHKEKIDMIYIDPPYNTGKDNFRYNDKIVGPEDSYKHSKWLNFMNIRLKLAKNLLKKDGVIFINIGNDEFAQLKLLCDEIFSNNFKDTLIWAYRTGGAPRKNDAFSKKFDYILFYSKSENYFFNSFKERITYEKDFFGTQKDLNKKQCADLNEKEKEKIINFIKKGENLNSNLKEVLFDRFYAEVNLRDIIEGNIDLIKDNKIYKTFNTKPVLNLSSESIENFSTQKPVGLLEYLFEIFSKKDAIILDFFAGSGSTGHAILHMNKVDGGCRKFILCTNNEDLICENTCYPRLKWGIIGHPKFKTDLWKLGGNLKYFKTDFIDVESIQKVTDSKKLNLTYQAGELIAIKEDAFEELEKNEYYQIFKNDNKVVGIYFIESHKKLKELFKKIDNHNNLKKIVYLFSWGKTEYTGEELGYSNIKIKDIPQPIIDVYKEINKI